MSADYNYAERWPKEFLRGMQARRSLVARNNAQLKNRDYHYARAHERMLRIYDAAIAAAKREIADEAAFPQKQPLKAAGSDEGGSQ